MAGTGRAARGGQADTEHALLGVTQTLLVPTGFSWELGWGSGGSRDWLWFPCTSPSLGGRFLPKPRERSRVSVCVRSRC